jgi:hypothetical protein
MTFESSGVTGDLQGWLPRAWGDWGETARGRRRAKKEPPSPAAQGDNREASNRVDRSHSMSRNWTINVMNEKA